MSRLLPKGTINALKHRRRVRRTNHIATSVKLTPQIVKELKAEARKQERSVSSLMRLIIIGWINFRRADVGKLEEK